MAKFPVVTTEEVPGKPKGFLVQTVMSSSTMIHHIAQGLNAFPHAFNQALNSLVDSAKLIGADAVVGLRISTSRHPGDTVAGMKDDTLVLVGTAITFEEYSEEELETRAKKVAEEMREDQEANAREFVESRDARNAASDDSGQTFKMKEGVCDCSLLKRAMFGNGVSPDGLKYCMWCERPAAT